MSAQQSTSLLATQDQAYGANTDQTTAQLPNGQASESTAPTGDYSTENGSYDALLGYYLPTSSFKFSSQTLSLIESVSLSHGKHEEFDDFYPILKDHLLTIPSSEPLSLEDSRAQLQKCGVRIPLSDPIAGVNYKIGFVPPKQVDIIGSWSLKNGISLKRKNQHVTIDVLVEIPLCVLQHKDYLSNRYFYKRAHYLAHIAKSFSKPQFSESYEFAYSYLEGDSFKPIIIIEPRTIQNSPPKWTARLMLSYPSSLFPLSKLSPFNPNLKPSQDATPYYNQSILMDSNELQLKFHAFFKEISTKYSAFNPTCQLVKVWAQQKAFYCQPKTLHQASKQSQPLIGFGRFGWLINFLVANVLLAAEQGGQKPHSGGSILHSDPTVLFRRVIDWLAGWKLDSKVAMQTIESPDYFPKSEFDAFETVLIDPTGLINLTAGIPTGTLKLLRASAERTACLLRSSNDVFAAIFPRVSRSFASSFDHHFIVRISDEDIRRLCKEEATMTIFQALRVLSKSLEIALGNRVVGFALLCQFLDASLSLDRASSNGSNDLSDSIVVQVGLTLDLTTAFNLITLGPSLEQSSLELKEFREFWGPRSEPIHYQDGSMRQSVRWKANHPLERMQCVKQITRWLLIEKLKFRDDPRAVWDLISSFDSFIFENPHDVPSIYEKDPMIIGFVNVMEAFNQLSKQLKSLKDKQLIPLSITSVLPVSEFLRYSSVFIPGPRRLDKYEYQDPTTKYLPSIRCQLRVESTGNWPENLEAIQSVKAALLCEVGQALRSEGNIVDCKLEYDYNALPIAHNVTLDVLHSTGYAFKLMICYEREEKLLVEASLIEDQDKRIKPPFRVSWALEALGHFRKTFLESKKHHDAISALQARFPSYTYTVRLIKRWFSTHMLLSTHISIELIELLASAIYLLPEDELPPTTGVSGFMRFLKFLKFWDWRREPLLLPLSTSVGLSSTELTHFPLELLKSAVNNFESTRKKDPGLHELTYFVATEDDLSGARWMISSSSNGGYVGDKKKKPQTILRPNRLIADRVQTLASASIKVLESALGRALIDFQPTAIFKSPLSDYDFHLILDLSCFTRLHQSFDLLALPPNSQIRSSGKDKRLCGSQSVPEIDDDPVLGFVKELQLIYGDWIEFFYDQFGGPLIVGVMNREITQMDGEVRAKNFKPTLMNHLTKPITDDHQSLAKDGTTNDIPTAKKIKKNHVINGSNHKSKVIFDLDGALFDIFVGIGNGLVVKISKKGVDY